LHENRVLAERGAQGQLIKRDDFAASLDDAVTSAVRNAQSTDLEMDETVWLWSPTLQ
jgi:hypothetical protein